MRTELLAVLTTALTAQTQFNVSQELPWSQNGQPLYRKNMKYVYVDRDIVEQTTLIPVLSGEDVFQDDYIVNVYLAVDAKNPPSQLDQAISNILAAKNSITLVNFGFESDYTVEKDEDVLIYTFEFRMNTINI
jgi:hypothetical protein